MSPTSRVRTHLSAAFEELSTKALAINVELLRKFNGFLEALNDGRSVVFVDKATGIDAFECDGLVKNSTVVLLNEAKNACTQGGHWLAQAAARKAGARHSVSR